MLNMQTNRSLQMPPIQYTTGFCCGDDVVTHIFLSFHCLRLFLSSNSFHALLKKYIYKDCSIFHKILKTTFYISNCEPCFRFFLFFTLIYFQSMLQHWELLLLLLLQFFTFVFNSYFFLFISPTTGERFWSNQFYKLGLATLGF